MSAQRTAEQYYTLTDVSRLLQVPVERLRELQALGEFPNPDMLVPGGGRKAERWSATRLSVAAARWDPTRPL